MWGAKNWWENNVCKTTLSEFSRFPCEKCGKTHFFLLHLAKESIYTQFRCGCLTISSTNLLRAQSFLYTLLPAALVCLEPDAPRDDNSLKQKVLGKRIKRRRRRPIHPNLRSPAAAASASTNLVPRSLAQVKKNVIIFDVSTQIIYYKCDREPEWVSEPTGFFPGHDDVPPNSSMKSICDYYFSLARAYTYKSERRLADGRTQNIASFSSEIRPSAASFFNKSVITLCNLHTMSCLEMAIAYSWLCARTRRERESWLVGAIVLNCLFSFYPNQHYLIFIEEYIEYLVLQGFFFYIQIEFIYLEL